MSSIYRLAKICNLIDGVLNTNSGGINSCLLLYEVEVEVKHDASNNARLQRIFRITKVCSVDQRMQTEQSKRRDEKLHWKYFQSIFADVVTAAGFSIVAGCL